MITEEYIPLHKVIKLLQDFADRHININSFGFGNLLEYGKDIEDRTNLYPVMFVVPQSASYDVNTTDYTLSVIIADRLSDDLDNRISCISNMSMIAKDLIGEIKLGDLQDYFDVSLPAQSNMFIERFMDNIGGIQINLPLTTLDPINVCENFLTDVIYKPNEIENLFAWYDFQDSNTITLTGGTNITQLLDKSGNDYHLTPETLSPVYSASTSVNTNGLFGMVDVSGNTSLSTLITPVSPNGMTLFYMVDNADVFRYIGELKSTTGSTNVLAADKFSVLQSSTNFNLRANGYSRGTSNIVNSLQKQFIIAVKLNSNNQFTITLLTKDGENTINYVGFSGASVSNLDTIVLGHSSLSPSVPPRIIYEGIMYDRILNDVEYNGVLSYLKDKYNYKVWI